jgi:hypothetical protein
MLGTVGEVTCSWIGTLDSKGAVAGGETKLTEVVAGPMVTSAFAELVLVDPAVKTARK